MRDETKIFHELECVTKGKVVIRNEVVFGGLVDSFCDGLKFLGFDKLED
jgi:hypothetical protein